jgi:proline iminopeptidase
VLGDGPAVVLLHAGPGLDGSIFLPGAERLAGSYTLHLVDLPGNGRSPDLDEWTFAGMARAVEDYVRPLGEYTLLGHSFGGYVTMQHLADFPGSAARVIASCTDADEAPAPGAGDPEDAYRDLPPELEAAWEREEQVSSDEEARENWFDLLPFFAPTPERVEAVRSAFADVVFRHVGQHEWGELHALDVLAAADVPVLAVAGELDRGTPVAAARRIAETAPRGELAVIEGAGHFPFAEDPDAYWGAVGEWLERT